MTPDATGHGTQDARDTARPVPATPTPRVFTSAVPYPDDFWMEDDEDEQDTGHGTDQHLRDTVPSADGGAPHAPRDTNVIDGTTARDVPQDVPSPGLWQRYKVSRASRKAARDASRVSREHDATVSRALEEAARVARVAERDRQRDALSRVAASRRHGSRVITREARAEQIAPIPPWMLFLGVWLDRTIGATPLLAPLVVSGYFTVGVFTDAPLSTPLAIALAITAALEGGVWKLSRIYEATLLEGDSTLGLRVAIGLYLALISGMIYGHAYFTAKRDAEAAGLTNVVVDWSKWAPAAGVAVMSALGVLVWSKQARYQHRVALRAAGQIDPRAPKFASLAWGLHSPETFAALRHSVKYRISSPVDAVADLRHYRAAGKPPIWPIPPGFSWINGTLTLVEPITGHHPDDDPGTGHPATGRTGRDTVGTGHPTAPGMSPGHGSQDTHGTPDTGQATGHHGTQDTGHHGTQDTDGSQDTHGTHGTGNGTPDVTPHGTQDTDGTQDTHGTPDDSAELAGVLKYTEHLIAVTEAFPDWKVGAPPSVRKITAAVNEYRRNKDGGSYRSNDTSKKVQDALVNLRRRPELLDVMKVQQEGPTT